jgi:deazaflavin-dependent oxidoreductase (nitroreductase family)
MPITTRITTFNKRFLNPVMLHLAGLGSMVDLEHVGRTTGRTFHTPLMAFRHGDAITIALTYGPDVQWLKNITAAGTCQMRFGPDRFALGPPHRLDPADGLARTPQPQRFLLHHVIRCRDFIELPVLAADPAP